VKKLLILIISIGLIFGLVGIGTQAYFSDVETSSENIFTAGVWDNPKVITGFSFQGLSPDAIGVVDEVTHTIALTVPFETDVTTLVPTIAITGASVDPASGVARDFTSPVTYTVTAADSSTRAYVVTVTVAAVTQSTVATVTSATYTVSAGGTATETITNVPFSTTNATFLAALTKGQVNQTWVDIGIADPVVTDNTLVVTAQDGTTVVTYTVTVNVAPEVVLNSIAITTPATKLTYAVGDTLDITGLVVTGTYSDGSTKVETITTVNVTDFNSSTPVTGQVLTITVDGKTATYTVTVN
jgi:predicted ribosomally synthesized peptide with SipW-like signal peptide